jgi:glycosyltransferase involved in cell wall biosynthesis
MTATVSLIITVKNEGDAIRPLLDSLLDQTELPDEIIITDGGSTDHTLDVIHEYAAWLPLQIIPCPGANISQGRNFAIAHAHGEIIAVTDAGVTLSPVWLEEITRPLREESAEKKEVKEEGEGGNTAVQVVSGWFESDPFTDFEVVLGATVLPDRADIDPATFLPSSRSVAFRKSAWQAVGGYPEWLDYSEDLLFDMALQQQCPPFAFAPYAVAYFRPRRTLRAFFKQYYLYARGDGKADLWRKRHLIRYLTYLVALPFILRLIWHERKVGWLLLLAGTAVYTHRPAQRLWPLTHGWTPVSRVRAFALIPIIRLVGDVAKMLGYPIGLWWRWQNRP